MRSWRNPELNRKWNAGRAALLAVCSLGLLAGAGCKGRGASGDVIAKVNGRNILRTETEKYYRNQTEGQPDPSPDQAQSLRLSILRELIENEMLLQRAEKLGLMATDAEVDSKLSEIKAPYTSDEFDKKLKDRALTLEDFKHDLRRTITVDKVLNKEVTSKVNVKDDEISNYYDQHKTEFNLIVPQYHLAQILVTSQPSQQVRNLKNDKAQNEAEAKKKVVMLLTRLQSGDDFAALARDYSEQPDTAASGGDLGFIAENSLQGDRQAYEAIGRLKVGEYTPPLPAADAATHQIFGFRIIKLISKEPAGQRQLTEPKVRQAIHDQLRDQREQLLKTAYLESLHDHAKVENYLADQILSDSGK
jgi:peptidyl-prolyl cis-trans isomerase SurA